MAYNSNVPLGSQPINSTTASIRENFSLLTPWGTGYGKFTPQGSTPSFDANVDYIYCANFGPTSKNELYIHRQGVSGLTEVPFTASRMSAQNAATSISGWSYLPSGMLIKWGQIDIVTDNDTSVNVATISQGPAFIQAFQVFVTPCYSSGTRNTFTAGVRGNPANTGNFTVYANNSRSAGETFIRYLVIGI